MIPAEGTADAVLSALQGSGLARAVGGSAWLYPAVEIVHIAGFVILVGAAFVFDLRLLGLLRRLPIEDAVRHLTRWARWSLLLVVPSGIVLFVVEATSLASNPAFQLKLFLMGAAGLNAALFHGVTYRGVDATRDPRWSGDGPLPWGARLAGVFSILLWFSVIAAGRLIAYV